MQYIIHTSTFGSVVNGFKKICSFQAELGVPKKKSSMFEINKLLFEGIHSGGNTIFNYIFSFLQIIVR